MPTKIDKVDDLALEVRDLEAELAEAKELLRDCVSWVPTTEQELIKKVDIFFGEL